MRLYPINRGPRDNRYCGPAVVSFITGMNTSDVATRMREHNGAYAIRGTWTSDVRCVLNERGFSLVRRPIETKNCTLARWLKDTKDQRTAGRVFLIVAGNHWQLVSGRKYACGRIGDIVSIRDSRVKRRARVTEVYEVMKSTTALRAPRKKGKLL